MRCGGREGKHGRTWCQSEWADVRISIVDNDFGLFLLYCEAKVPVCWVNLIQLHRSPSLASLLSRVFQLDLSLAVSCYPRSLPENAPVDGRPPGTYSASRSPTTVLRGIGKSPSSVSSPTPTPPVPAPAVPAPPQETPVDQGAQEPRLVAGPPQCEIPTVTLSPRFPSSSPQLSPGGLPEKPGRRTHHTW
jgi:hypothetical protein